MIVLFIGPLPEPVTGQSLACQVFLDELTKHHHVEVINLSKKGFRQGVDSVARVFEVLRIVLAVWRKKDAQVIYFTVSESFAGNMKDLLIYLLCFRRLSSMVIHLHGGAGIRGIMLRDRGLQRKVNEFFVRRLGGAIVLGPRHADIFRHALPLERIHVVPNFAQDYLFADAESIDRKFRHVRPLRLLYLSNLLPGKGCLELLDGFFALDQQARTWVTLDLAGSFESEAHKRAFLDRIAGVPQIRYHGTVRGEQKKELFHQAHIFCLPTYYRYEGQPISILEAYASGCAVITTDHSGIGDVFTDGVNGYEVSKGSAGALRVALERAAAEPDRLHAMATANAQTARLQYRTSHYNANLMRVIDSLVKQ